MNEFKRTGLKPLFAALIFTIVSGTAFSQTFPSLEPYYTYNSTSNADSSTLSAHEMIATGLSFSEYPLVDQRKYMNIYLELEAQATSRSFMSMGERNVRRQYSP